MNVILNISSIGSTLAPSVSTPVILQFFGFGGPGVQSVNGNLVFNGDPFNPIVNDAVSTDAGNDAVLGTDGLTYVPERVQSVTGNLTDNTDPLNPVIDQSVSADANNDATLGTDGLVFVPERVQSVSGDNVDNTDPLNPVIKAPANLSFYPTTAASDIPTYVKLVTNITDPDYDDPAVNVPTGTISGQGQLLSRLAAAPGVFIGNPGVITISTVGEIRRTSGTGVAEFYFEAYHRNSLGVETLIGTSNNTAPVSVSAYTQFQASLLLNNGVFTATDRLVLKFYGNRIAGGSNPSYDFLFGGANPVRTLFPIAAGLISNVQSVNGYTGVVVLNASDVGALATVAVDGVTITGDGTPGNPLVSVGGGGGLDQLQIVLNSQVYS